MNDHVEPRRQPPYVALLAAGAGVAATALVLRWRRGHIFSADTLESGVGMRVIESVTINRPVQELFALWRNLPNVTVVHEVEPESLSWQSPNEGPIQSVGSMRLTPLARGGAQLSVALQYRAPLSRWVESPAARLREDLRRLKQWLEAGEEPTTEGQPSGPRTSTFRFLKDVAA